MPLSNTTQEILRSSPYWDDFDQTKRFSRILIKPKTPVQTRELNQMQSMLQNQLEQVTSSIYREGATVNGGQQNIANNAIVLQVVRTDTVNINNFYDADNAAGAIIEGQTSGTRAIVTQVDSQPASGTPYAAILFAPLNASQFSGDERIMFLSPITGDTIAEMNAAPSAAVTNVASTFSVASGTFYLRGHLIQVPTQTVILEVGTQLPSKRVGFIVSETIVTSTEDSTLLDPALGSTNYAAPGADRLKLSAVLSVKDINIDTITPNADAGFVEIARIIEGVIQQQESRLNTEFIEDTLARRTNDESGDYVVKPFRLLVKDHNPPIGVPNITGRLSGNTTSATVNAANTITTIVNANGSSSNVTTLFSSQMSVGDVLVINGESRAITAITNNTQLIVNAAFTQTFTNTSATVISNDKLNIELEKGKAYVRGYEIETAGTLKLAADRARTIQHVNNGKVATRFGPYVIVTKNNDEANGSVSINSLELLDLHSVSYSNVATSASAASEGSYYASKIGTARARSFVYNSGIGNANTTYKLYLVDAQFETKTLQVNTTAAAANTVRLTGNSTNAAVVVTASARTIRLRQETSVAASGFILSTGTSAYTGATIKLYTTDGTRLIYPILASTNTEVNSTCRLQTLTLDADDSLQYVNATANVQIVFNDKCIRSVTTFNTGATPSKAKGMTTDILSKVGYAANGNTVVYGTTAPALLFRYREGVVKPSTIQDETYDTVRHVTAIANTTGNSTHAFFVLSQPTQFNAASQEAPYDENPSLMYEDIVATATANGDCVPLQGAEFVGAISATSMTIAIPKSNFTGAEYGSGTVDFHVRTMLSNASPRIKTLYAANTNVSSVSVNNTFVFSNVAINAGHVAINNVTATSSRTLGLGIVDVSALQKVYAVVTPNNTATWVDVTDRYILDSGQRSWCYDHASITLTPSASHYTANCTKLVVMVDRYEHSPATLGLSYFNPSSYAGVDYEDIPAFTDLKTGQSYSLRTHVDFRPLRTANANAVATATANTAQNPYANAAAYTFETTVLPHPESVYQADYDFYLSRIDKVVLTKDKQFRIITGTPSVDPVVPADDPEGITLYVVAYPAYTAFPELVNVRALEYRRYTMKDIRQIEKRIENLEYYAALSIMDMQTLNTTELDEYDTERFKNGIVTDNFSTAGTIDFTNADTKVSLDQQKQELRPLALVTAYDLDPDTINTSNVVSFGNSGRMLSLPYTSVPFTTQGLASKSININPFNVFSWRGTLTLFPSTDTWIDEITRPNLVTNLFNENDGIRDGVATIATRYNHWSTVVVGVSVSSTTQEVRGFFQPDEWARRVGRVDRLQRGTETLTTATTTTNTTDFSQAVHTQRRASTISTDLGERIIDSSIASKMRGSDVHIAAQGLLPGATLRASFDDIDVTSYIERANRITIAATNVTTFAVDDDITTTAGGRGRIVGIATDSENNVAYLYVVDAQGVFTGTINSRRNSKGLIASTVTSVAISAYQHVHGKITAITSTTNTVAGPWTLTLDTGAPTAGTDTYTGNVIHFTDGGSMRRVNLLTGTDVTETSGVGGFKAIITSYDAALRKIIITALPADLLAAFISQKSSLTTWNPIRYSIGNPESSVSGSTSVPVVSPGSFYGLFRLPGMRIPTGELVSSRRYDRVQSSALQFNVGTRILQLRNDASVFTDTFAQAGFTAQGSTLVKQRNIVRTRQIDSWEQINEITSSTSTDIRSNVRSAGVSNISYIDPLAQTFLISGDTYPDGLFVTHVDLFFAKKGVAGLDVTMQIRTTVNGVPSADQVLGSSIVSAGNINVVPGGVTPNPGNASHYTRFTFNAPIYLATNQEYALTILSNSNEYEVFVGEIGQRLLASDKIISQQPHGGVLFKSQNARTWVPEPLEDLMFVLHRAEFEMKQGTLSFQLANGSNTLINNTQFDTAYVNMDYLDWVPSRQYTEFDIVTRTTASDTATTIPIRPRTNVEMPEQMSIDDGVAGSFRLRATLRTTSSHVSPIYDAERVNTYLIRNVIDNGRLYANGVAFTPGTLNGSSINAAVSIPLTVSGGNGTGADVRANTNSSGFVTSIYVANSGYGYTETPTIVITNTNGGFSTQPTFLYVGETSPSSHIVNERKARYITRKINLADGFDAGDLKVYLSAVRAPQHDIDVYYKVLATGDSERFEDKSWTRMQLRSDLETVYSSTQTERKEYEYRTIANTASYTSSDVTFDRFHTFAVKLVLRSAQSSNTSASPEVREAAPYASDTVVVPRVSNLRVMALDE